MNGWINHAVAAWTPLLEPLAIDDYWLMTLIPVAIIIAVVYKAIRIDDLARLKKEAAVMCLQILTFMVVAAVVLWIVTESV